MKLLLSLVGATLALAVGVSARGDVNELLRRVPSDANAIVAVDATRLTDSTGSPDASRPAARPKSPVPLPKVAGLRSLVLASRLHTASMEPAWEVALLEVSQKPSMQAVALASGGYPDTAAGRPAAWCASDIYCVAIDDRTVAAVHPADRQFAARLLAQPAPKATGSDYLAAATSQVNPQSPLVIAVDLRDAVSEAGVRRTFEAGRPAWAAQIPGDEKAAAKLLGSVRGVSVRIGTVGRDGADGELTADFGEDASGLSAGAKGMALGLLAEFGLAVPDLEAWEFSASGRAVTGKGRLSVTGVERLAGFLAAPGVGAPEEGGEATTAAAKGGKQADRRAESSRDYFNAVSAVLDSLRPGASLSDSAAWLTRNAKRIDQLSGLGVDPELLMWGADVSSKLREAAGILSAGQQRVRARTSAVQVSVAHVTDKSSPDPRQAAQSRADRENARRQAQQAGAEERAAVSQEAAKPLQAALESRGKVRAAMAERHGGGF